jgi:hypothetical protein
MPIVAQIFSQSARSRLAWKRTARGALVVPEVSLRNCGTGSGQHVASSATGRRWTIIGPPRFVTKAAARQAPSV